MQKRAKEPTSLCNYNSPLHAFSGARQESGSHPRRRWLVGSPWQRRTRACGHSYCWDVPSVTIPLQADLPRQHRILDEHSQWSDLFQRCGQSFCPPCWSTSGIVPVRHVFPQRLAYVVGLPLKDRAARFPYVLTGKDTLRSCLKWNSIGWVKCPHTICCASKSPPFPAGASA